MGVVYIVPPGMSATLRAGLFQIVPYDRGLGPITTINIVFESAAKAFGDRVIGVILTGLLRDGTVGLKAVHDAGGLTIVQDPGEAEYPDMPASAMKDLPVTFCLRVSDIGLALDLLARRKAMLETGLAISVRTLKERVALLVRLIDQSKRNPKTYEFLSTELAALKRTCARSRNFWILLQPVRTNAWPGSKL
jgi:two-component system chemotaxis response regulator CheB